MPSKLRTTAKTFGDDALYFARIQKQHTERVGFRYVEDDLLYENGLDQPSILGGVVCEALQLRSCGRKLLQTAEGSRLDRQVDSTAHPSYPHRLSLPRCQPMLC
jgi:hypothetical protein